MTSSLLSARRGSQTPRVAKYPRYAFSDAVEVIELYEAVVGRPLDPWQKFVLRHGLGRLTPEQWAAFKVACWVARQNGKGDIILALELAWLFLPGFQVKLITHSAHLYSTAQEAFLRIKDILDGSDDLRPTIKAIREANGEQGIILRTGQRLKFMARTRTGGRGFSAPRIVLDEAQELQPLMMASALPTMSAQPDPQVWFFGTPPDDPAAWVYNLKADGEAAAPDLAWFDWGAALDLGKAEDRARVKDPELWYACNPALGVRITERFVEGESRPSGLGELFPYERLGVWRPRATTTEPPVLDPDLWAKMLDPESKRADDVALAVDVAPLRDHASISMVGPRDDDLWHMQLVDYRPGTDWVVERLAELKDFLDPVAICFDGKGGAAALLDDLAAAGMTPPENPEEPARGDLIVTGASDVAAAVAQFIDDYRAVAFRHPDQQPLTDAIANAKTRPIGDAGAIAWGRKASSVDIGPLITVTLARWAYLARIEAINQVYEPSAFWA